MANAYAVLFNNAITTGGTQQSLDPTGTEQLSYAQTLVIKALSTNTGRIYIQSVSGAGATVGFPLDAGEQIVINFPSTGLYVNGTVTGDKYGVAGS